MTSLTLMGTLGALFLLIAFILNQLHVWKENYLLYDLCNLVGSFLLVLYALELGSYPFAVLNIVWFSISTRDVISDIRGKEHRKRWFFTKWLK